MLARTALQARLRPRYGTTLSPLPIWWMPKPRPGAFRYGSFLQHPNKRPHLSKASMRHYRTLFTDGIPPILTPPLVFVGLLLALWTWKCAMMILFQDKIIYMPNMPPFSRSEKLEDYAKECKQVEWSEKHIRSLDGTKIALAIGHLRTEDTTPERTAAKNCVICYFQGNGGSIPPRLPILSNVLKDVVRNSPADIRASYSIIALSYRGYWTSSGRASQVGIELDAQALLNYVKTEFAESRVPTEIILYGQSIGSGIATTAAATYLAQPKVNQPPITVLVLETPFSGIRSMLVALYPQRWLPYRYLWPFLWNHWDTEAALYRITASEQKQKVKVCLLPASRDEVVPAEEADKIEKICTDLSMPYERRDVVGALHNEASVRRDGQQAVAEFIVDTISSSK